MITKRILIWIPIALIIVLIQSYFWIPSFERQEKGNPERFDDFVYTSIGDATLLNPILSSDIPSFDIEFKVFDPLVELDENLRLTGRLATGWNIHEEAFFYVNNSADIAGRGRLSGQQVVDLLRSAMARRNPRRPELEKTLKNIQTVALMPPGSFTTVKERKIPGETEGKSEISVTVSAPARIKLELAEVDQDLFNNLTALLGENYFSSFQGESFLKTDPRVSGTALSELAREILPATEHNPIIDFKLRPNVKFHDGHIFDARDVKFTYEAIMDPRNLSPAVAGFEPVKEIKILDPLNVRVVYKRLFSPGLYYWTMQILPEHLLNAEALAKEARAQGKDPKKFSVRDSSFNRHPIGCGAYQFVEWKSDREITLERFDDYWEGAPNYKLFTYRIIPDLLAQEMELYAGTVDYYEVQPYQVHRMVNDPRFQSFSVPRLGYTYICYNERRKPFDDRRVRLALSKAIDVDKIIKYVLDDQGERTTGPFPIQTEYYNHEVQPVAYDPEGSLKLLAEAGWKRNREGWLEKDGQRLQLTLITNNGNDIRKAILAIAQDAWTQIGIDVRTDSLEWSVFIQERVDKMDFDALVLGWILDIEPDQYMMWHSSQTGVNQLNFGGFKNPEADELLEKIRQEYDHDRKVSYCHRLHEIIAREQPYTFLFVPKWTAVMDKRIVIQEINAEGKKIYRKIPQPPIDDLRFLFNKFVKLERMPKLEP